MKICTGINTFIRFVSILAAIFLTLILPSQAQSQSEDVQQMRDKLQKLEQEIEELKGQLNKNQQAPAPATTTTTVVVRAEQEAEEVNGEFFPQISLMSTQIAQKNLRHPRTNLRYLREILDTDGTDYSRISRRDFTERFHAAIAVKRSQRLNLRDLREGFSKTWRNI